MNFVLTKDHRYLFDERKIKEVINENKLELYKKLPLIKVGDYVTCCDKIVAIDTENNAGDYDRYSWEEGKVVCVTKVNKEPHVYYIQSTINATVGILASGIRFSTEDEIKAYKKKYKE